MKPGCSRLIADGKIAIKQGVQIERFTTNEVVFTDGSTLSADIVVLATGYKNMRESARVPDPCHSPARIVKILGGTR